MFYGQVTWFEFMITMAFIYFYENEVDYQVVETGLGGRLDATTAHPFRPIIAMGSIDLDHSEYLGKTLKDAFFINTKELIKFAKFITYR